MPVGVAALSFRPFSVPRPPALGRPFPVRIPLTSAALGLPPQA